MPRGRPPMDCQSIDEKTFGRKRSIYIEKARKKKCDSRIDHPNKPCKRIDNKCVSATTKPNLKKTAKQVVISSKQCEKIGKNLELYDLKQDYKDTKDAVVSRFTKKCESAVGENGQPCKTTLNMVGDKISCKGSVSKVMNKTCKELFADEKKRSNVKKMTFKEKKELCKKVGKDNNVSCSMKSNKKGCVKNQK